MSVYPASPASQPAPPRDLITSLLRGLRIMELLAAAPEGLLAKTISARSGLNLSTCYHLLNTLVDAGYVLKPAGSQRYSLSGKVSYPSFASLEGAPLVAYLLPYLQALRDETQETAYLSLRDGDAIVLSAIVDSPATVKVGLLFVGYDEANHATALGKAVLAHLDDYDVTAYLERRGMPALTRHTLTDPAALKQELLLTRERGYSLDREEFAAGVCCIGAPIFNASGRVIASLGIPLPCARFKVAGDALAKQVVASAAAATRALTLVRFTGL
jgi:DNA-binding IclR family transcriptional regulator